jgi:ferredoxin/flavodoxin---NADP+ reductase
MNNIYDLTIVGLGPVGLFGSFYAGMRGLKTIALESRQEVGGALTAVYPDKFIYDMVGFPKIQAKKLIENLEAQSSHFDNDRRLGFKVDEIIKNSDNLFEVSCGSDTILSKSILVTTGMGAFTPRKLPLKNIEKYEAQENSGIVYIVRNKERYYGKKVVIIGGGNSALDWAHDFDGNSQSVSLIHALPNWQAHEDSIHKLETSNINVYQPFTVKEVIGEEKLEKIIIQNGKSKESIELEADLLLVNIGFLPSKTTFENIGLELNRSEIVVNPATMESTTVPGLFCAGDACSFDGKLKLICIGSAEAAIAVNNAATRIDSSAARKPKFSSAFFSKDMHKKEDQKSA